jgi:hypothetical protein
LDAFLDFLGPALSNKITTRQAKSAPASAISVVFGADFDKMRVGNIC